MKIVSANRLLDGIVVYLTAQDTWSEDVTQAAIAESDEEVKRLEGLADQAVADNLVVGPVVGAINRDGAKVIPIRNMERIRSLGPTIRPDLGKQADTFRVSNA